VTNNKQAKTEHAGETDGRKQRSNDSRRKIVTAYLALLREGNIIPSAEEVAKKADVGLRTVFRRFNEMELLFREMTVEIEKRFVPELERPWQSKDWEGRLAELIERKAAIYEDILPYHRAGQHVKTISPFVMENTLRWQNVERSRLEYLLPFSQQDQPELFAAFASCLNADNWLHLRDTQGLNPQQAYKTMELTVAALLAHFEISS